MTRVSDAGPRQPDERAPETIDPSTNRLVYRNLAKGDVIKGASSATRAARIDAAVARALAPFFGRD
jgi:hypothetical protein